MTIWHDPDLRTRPHGTADYATLRDADLAPLGPPLDEVPGVVEALYRRTCAGVVGRNGAI